MAVAINKVGVIGSGQMGNGIAHVTALAGIDVVLNDVSADRLKSAMATINGNLSMTSTSTLTVDVLGTTACTDYDQIVVNGTVSLGNAALAGPQGHQE